MMKILVRLMVMRRQKNIIRPLSKLKDVQYYMCGLQKSSKLLKQFMDYSISSGLITLKGFFQVQNHKEYQNVVIISFVHLEKINIFCFMHKGVAQKLSLPRPLEN